MKQTLPPCAIGFLYLNSILWWRLVYGYTNTRTLIKSCDCHHNPQHSIYIILLCCLFPQTRVRKTTRLHDILVWKWMKRKKKWKKFVLIFCGRSMRRNTRIFLYKRWYRSQIFGRFKCAYGGKNCKQYTMEIRDINKSLCYF